MEKQDGKEYSRRFVPEEDRHNQSVKPIMDLLDNLNGRIESLERTRKDMLDLTRMNHELINGLEIRLSVIETIARTVEKEKG